MTTEEQAAFARARDVVDFYAARAGGETGFVTRLLEDLATYQRKVGVCTLVLLAQSATEVDRRRARLA